MKTEVQQEHQWLQQLVGEWTYQGEVEMGPGKPPEKFEGTESVRTLGGLWVQCEGRGEMPGGGMATTVMTLGYDTQKQRFVGSWIGSMMSCQWIYDGTLDAASHVLTLDTEGPDFVTEGKTARYRDEIEIISHDQRVLSSHVQGDDGQWRRFMRADYQRKK